MSSKGRLSISERKVMYFGGISSSRVRWMKPRSSSTSSGRLLQRKAAMKSTSVTRSPSAALSSSYGVVSEFMWMKKSKSRCRMSRARSEHDWRRSHLMSMSSVISPG